MSFKLNETINGDSVEVLKTFDDNSIDCCVTSPPYWALRDYGVTGQIGLEETQDAYLSKIVSVFDEVRRVLKPTGTAWVNMGDGYAQKGKRKTREELLIDKLRAHEKGYYTNAFSGYSGWDRSTNTQVGGLKRKDMIGMPWLMAFALRGSGWYLRDDIIWSKKNPKPENVRDRCTKSHEYLFMFSKSDRYSYDYESIMEPSVSGETLRRKRSVWTVSTRGTKEAHFATFPEKLIEPCILAGCKKGGIVLDPFMGSGTTGRVASRLGRNYVGIELNSAYIEIEKSIPKQIPMDMV